MIASLLLLATVSAPDPRVPLVELQLEHRHAAALERVTTLIEAEPETAGRLGLHYLQGHLLESLGRPGEATDAYSASLGATPALAPYSRFRLAVGQSRVGHPEVAAGLLASLLAGGAPEPLVGGAVELFASSLAAGGDCRLLANRRGWPLPKPERRHLELAAADCARRNGAEESYRTSLAEVLAADDADDAAWRAAQRLLAASPPAEAALSLRIGLTLHHHRDFSRSTGLLESALDELLADEPPGDELLEAIYALARNQFWLGRYGPAADRFGEIARHPGDGQRTARALYQRARSLELDGDWSGASHAFRQAFLAEPSGRWASAALLSALRIEWRSGAEKPALEAYRLLTTERAWTGMLNRAALFLAASELVRGRTRRVGGWLDAAARYSRASPTELSYWRGRLHEAEGRPADAVASYLAILRREPHHPLARLAASRLAAEPLAAVARAQAKRRAGNGTPRGLHDAWLLAGDADPLGDEARLGLRQALAADPRVRATLDAELVPPSEWPLWRARLTRPEELLLALGIWELGAPVVLRHFPVSDVELAYTASRLLEQAGEARRSLYVAEILARRLPASVPSRLLPAGLRQLLYPLPYRTSITREADRRRIDPFLLAAIIREESRFDPDAVSPASARGLTQFTLQTAARFARAVELPLIDAADLHRPELSIALGATYLAELSEQFDGREHQMVAAYNAGEPQAQLWRSYCFSTDPAEYFSKVGFPQTRSYLAKVLSSRVQYAEIWAGRPSGG